MQNEIPSDKLRHYIAIQKRKWLTTSNLIPFNKYCRIENGMT